MSHLLGFEREYEASGDGVRVIEHILLRPAGAPFRISVLFPDWTDRGLDESFRKFAENTVDAACPAHIYAGIHWLNREMMDRFDALHREWWNCDLEAQLVRLRPRPAFRATLSAETAEAAKLDQAIQRAAVAARELLAFLRYLEQSMIAGIGRLQIGHTFTMR